MDTLGRKLIESAVAVLQMWHPNNYPRWKHFLDDRFLVSIGAQAKKIDLFTPVLGLLSELTSGNG
ncbi:hypothetical protein U7859_02140 [Bradyrhizobium ottawaense]|uniref:hypothetical protein n=1 Tax=Bradyrhizobium ottawaense TaxID=931866 RepID=UPI001BA6B4D2|nr:hypothetical protein [Bradyrhizobium ottawaense]MBR1335344.1 hypothetical protein [Bradyrhizobium ottawaense]WQN83303.1 hypothetical protein U7859_02140 [Bradyrhizobium ottawaense]